MASPAHSIPDTQLGLTNEEIQVLRRAQMAAPAAGSSSSRAASRASSQGLLLLDGSSLAALSRHFDRLMAQISERLEYLSEQSQLVTQQQYDRAGNEIELADAQIARFHELERQMDELDDDFDRIAHIKEIVKSYRQRIEDVERRLEESGSRRDGHSHSHSHSHSQSHGHGHRHRHGHGESSGSTSRRHRR